MEGGREREKTKKNEEEEKEEEAKRRLTGEIAFRDGFKMTAEGIVAPLKYLTSTAGRQRSQNVCFSTVLISFTWYFHGE